jgi:hypothetical protein
LGGKQACHVVRVGHRSIVANIGLGLSKLKATFLSRLSFLVTDFQKLLTMILKIKHHEPKPHVLHTKATDLVLRCLISSGGNLIIANGVAKSQEGY